MRSDFYNSNKNELLKWVNDLLQVNLTKIQQLGNGCLYLQILDAIYPDEKISLNKLNWKAKLQYQNLANLKLLDNWFVKLKIAKHIDVEKLAKAKYQDNLELIQWFKGYYDSRFKNKTGYNARERRPPHIQFPGHNITNQVYRIKAIPKQQKKIPMQKMEDNTQYLLRKKMGNDKKIQLISTVIMDHRNVQSDQKISKIKKILDQKQITQQEQNSRSAHQLNRMVNRQVSKNSKEDVMHSKENLVDLSISNIGVANSEYKHTVASQNKKDQISLVRSQIKILPQKQKQDRFSEPVCSLSESMTIAPNAVCQNINSSALIVKQEYTE